MTFSRGISGVPVIWVFAINPVGAKYQSHSYTIAMKKLTPSALKAKQTKPNNNKAKVTHETIQISLVRSVTTSGDKSSATTATSSGNTFKFSESKESVKDSSSSYSSSDTEPRSLTDSGDTSAGERRRSR